MKILVADLKLVTDWCAANSHDLSLLIKVDGPKLLLTGTDRNGKLATLTLYSTEAALSATLTGTETLSHTIKGRS